MNETEDDVFEPLDQQTEQQTSQQTQEPMVPMSQMMQLMQQFGVGQQAPAPQQQQEPQMTPEQRAAHLRQFQVDDGYATGFINALRPGEDGNINPANVKTALGSLVEGIRAEMLRGLELQGQQLSGQFDQRLSPVDNFLLIQRKEQAWSGFSQQYPALTNFRQFVDMEADRLAQSGMMRGMNQQQAFQVVANNVAQQLRTAGIQLPTNQQPQQTSQQPNQFGNNQQFPGLQPAAAPGMTMAPVGMGGVGNGSGGRKGGPQNKNPFFADDVWGNK